MPKLYNIQDWFTPEYERCMVKLLPLIPMAFNDPVVRDEEYLKQKRESPFPWHDQVYQVLSTGGPFIWFGDHPTIGENLIKTCNAFAMRSILPSYMVASIEVFDNGDSAAEQSMMPELLANRLTKESDQDERFNAFKNLF